MRISLDMAKSMLSAAVKQADTMEVLCSIAIVDEDGGLVGIRRMNGALIPTVDIARDKAWTAAVFKMPSSDISKFGDPAIPGFGLNTQNWNDRLTAVAGGLPIKKDDNLIGGIGVSGGTPEQDVVICQAGIAAIE